MHPFFQNISNYLCIGLDTDPYKIPSHLKGDVLEFNRQIIAATKSHCIAYKINTAFYESMGAKGWSIMEETMDVIPPTHFTIADAKRGDIGNSAEKYAEAFFKTLDFDAITVSAYMGPKTLEPYLDFPDKTVIALARTSNPGAGVFQKIRNSEGKPLFISVAEVLSNIYTPAQLMFVAGATTGEDLNLLREAVPDYHFLVPGVGAQGGTVQEVLNVVGPDVLINISRSILYASDGEDFAEVAEDKAREFSTQK